MWEAWSFDGVTGAVVDRIDVSAFSWERVLSNRGSGQVTFPLDGKYSLLQLRELFQPWSRILGVSYEGEMQFGGYVADRGYQLGAGLTLGVRDFWGRVARLGAWDHDAPDKHKWKETLSGSPAWQVAKAVERARDTGPSLPARGLPVTLPGGLPGASVTRKYFGYQNDMVTDVMKREMDEGLDIYFRPRFIGNGDFDWLYQAGPEWGSDKVHEFSVTVTDSPVSNFRESMDASRVTNNAHRIGEGAEEDTLARSSRNPLSPYPALDRVSNSKKVTDLSQLTGQATNDLAMYGHPTFQWDFDVHISAGVDVGDTVRLHFDGDPWITDGWHARRVVKVSGNYGSEFVSVSCQPTGGA